jgi:hypothetical protein
MRDKASKNILLDDVEFDPNDVREATLYAAEAYDLIPPLSSSDPTRFPFRLLLLIGTTGHLLRSGSILQLRNQLTYNDGGFQAGIDDKWQQYKALGDSFWTEFQTTAKQLKYAQNMNACFGDLASGYRNIPDHY